jgi:tetratricopeptide (TPR) repeat protein
VRRFAVSLSLALLLSPCTLSAQPKDDSRTYFDIGAKAYGAGRYTDAIQAFEEAYKRSQRPGLLFSLGQANRMEYVARSDSARLADAVRYYTEYLAREPGGKRAGEATEQLSRLKPLIERAGTSMPTTPTPVATNTKPRVMISSPTPGIRLTFDGKPVPHPFIAEVAPGKHKLAMTAPGHEAYSREVLVDGKTGSPPLDIPLKELPATLTLRAPDGAEVFVDGRLQGKMPLPPLPLTAGKHFVAVTVNGRQAFSSRLQLRRGEKRTLEADLPPTGQRTASWVLIGTGAAAIVTGGVLGFVSLQKQQQAEDIRDSSESDGNQPASDISRYEDLRQSRDDFRLAAIISTSAGVAVGSLGLVLRLFDEPRPPLPPAEEAVPGQKTRPETPSSMEISAAPFVLPGAGGVSVGGRF